MRLTLVLLVFPVGCATAGTSDDVNPARHDAQIEAAVDDTTPAADAIFPTEDASFVDGADADAMADGACTKEICNGKDDDCNGKVDDLDCGHDVVCEVFDDGYTNESGRFDEIYAPSAGSFCVPNGTSAGLCRHWFGRCKALAAADGHTHDVTFAAFDDGYSNITAHADSISIDGSGKACIPDGGGVCRKWFGRAVTNEVQGHTHDVECRVFDDGYANLAGPADATYFNAGSSLCLPSASPTGDCRKWFGRCHTK